MKTISVLPVQPMFSNTSQPFQDARRVTQRSARSPSRLRSMGVSPACSVLCFGVEAASELELLLDVTHCCDETELGFFNVIRVDGELDFIVDKCKWCVVNAGFLQQLMGADHPELADHGSSGLE